MSISLIAAVDNRGMICRDSALEGKLPSDRKRFRELTEGHAVIMGRKTFEAIGHALPNRRNIVITRQADYRGADSSIEVATSIDEALRRVSDDEEVFVIGGGEIFQQVIDRADKIYLTKIAAELDGDTPFPVLDDRVWQVMDETKKPPVDGDLFAYSFVILQRRTSAT